MFGNVDEISWNSSGWRCLIFMGGLENQFPHHECEIAQSEGATGKPFAKYWLHNNMVTVNGVKMGKSLGNSSP